MVEPPHADAVEVTVACGSREEAEAIAGALVDARLAACCQTWPVSSTYRWAGTVHREEEWLLLVKTSVAVVDRAVEAIRERHSYDVPAIVVMDVRSTGPGYAEWLADSTG